jgi:hypothetical protein
VSATWCPQPDEVDPPPAAGRPVVGDHADHAARRAGHLPDGARRGQRDVRLPTAPTGLSFRDQVFQNGPQRELRSTKTRRTSRSRSGARTAPASTSRTRAGTPHQAPIGFATIDTGHGKWRVFGMQQGGQTIQVAQPMHSRDQLALAAALRTVAPFLLMLPMLGVLIWVVVGRGLRPLDAVARAVSTRTPVALDPLPETGCPAKWCRWCWR